ncbi:MAG: DUF4395 domain-containing protein [Saprospiraceae bacterium]
MSQPSNTALPAAHINEYKVRWIAFLVLLSVGLYLLSRLSFIPILLVLDFGLRAFDLGRFSPFARLSDVLVEAFHLGVKPIFYPPKRFAARIGLLFSAAILVLHFLGITALIFAGVLGLFAALESLAGICAGCYVYNWLAPFWQKGKNGA